MLGAVDGEEKTVAAILTLDNSREDAARHNRYLLTAQDYLSRHESPSDTDCRFDVIEVRFERGKPVGVEVIQGAFVAE